MDEKLKVSVIVPIYNVEQYLQDCVESLINQTYRNIEIILVDDGSTDKSGEICDELAKKDQRIQVIHKPNGRTASARNAGISVAEGEYLLFIDPDDWFDLQTVEKLVKEIERTDADVLRFNYIREYGDYSQENGNFLLENKVYQGEEYNNFVRQNVGLVGSELGHIENFNFCASVCFGCYRKSVIVENELQFTDIKELGSFSDGLFNLQYLLKASSFFYLNEHLYHYRKNNVGSYTNRTKKDLFDKNLVLLDRIKQVVQPEEKGADFEKAYYNRVAYGVLELILNVMKDKDVGFKYRYKEIKKILKHPLYKMGYKRFKLKYLPLKWKAYYAFVKMRWTGGVYLITKAVLRLKGRK